MGFCSCNRLKLLKVKVDLIDYDDALVLDELLALGTGLADMVKKVSEPAEERPTAIRERRKRNLGAVPAI